MKTMPSKNDAVKLVCWKVWGGNERTDIKLSIPGFDGVLHSSPYKSVAGGDLYYLSACGSGAISRLCLADVSGHGAKMAPVSQWFENAFAKQIHLENPGDVLAAVNQQAVSSSFPGFSTAICASYNSLNGDFHYCYGGHPYIRICRNGKNTWEELSPNAPDSEALWNLPLGVSADSEYAVCQTTLEPGDRLVFYTDGLVEARDANGSQLGKSLWDLLKRVDIPSKQLASILDSVESHIGNGCVLDDDITLIVFDVEPYQHGNKYSLFFANHFWLKAKKWFANVGRRVNSNPISRENATPYYSDT